MATMRDIKRRIRSIRSTQQITRAMMMVSAAKLRRAQAQVQAARPYSSKLEEVIGRLVLTLDLESYSHPLLEVREKKTAALAVISGDRGLCGPYNANLIKKAQEALNEQVGDTVIAIGRKGRDFFSRRGVPVLKSYLDLGDNPEMTQARELARQLMAFFTGGEIDELHLVYSDFHSALSQKPLVKKLLPVTGMEELQGQEATEYLFEPSPEEVLGSILPRFVEMQVYRAVLEAKASEHGARMAAMDAATRNAGEMIEELTLSFNRVRQATITREISEIVGGAEAQKT